MKVNVFKIENDKVDDLTVELEDNGFECEADNEDENGYTALYLRKKRSENKGWLGYYQQLLSDDKFSYYTENIGSETVSGLFLIQKDEYSYVLSYVRKSKSTTGLLHHLSKQTVCTPIGAKQYLLGEIPKTLCKKTTPKK